MTDFFNADNIWPTFGPFSHGVVLGDGVVVHLKGQIPLDADGEIVGVGDMTSQVTQVLENIKSVLKTVGGDMSHIVSVTQYTTEMDSFMAAGEVRRAFFSEPYPISTTLGVSRLYHPDVLVEISAIAEIPRDRYLSPA